MKLYFTLPFILFTTYTVMINTTAETVSGVVKDDPLLLAIESKQTERKLNLLTQFVAFEWEYQVSTESANAYLSKVADFALKNYNLTVKQKVNYIKATQILHLLKRTTAYEEHIARAYWLDKAVATSTKENISEYSYLEMKYLQEENSVNGLTLREGQLALDLLVQSFAPANIYTMKHNFRSASKEYNNLELELIIQSMRRAIGTLKLTNILLDPPFRINISVSKALDIQRTQFLLLLEEKIKANYEVIYKIPEYQNGLSKSSINSQNHILPMITVYPSMVASIKSDWNGKRKLEASTELNVHAETDSATTSELHSHAQSKSIPITESDTHAEGDAEKSTKSGIRISECTESRPQIKNDAVAPTAPDEDVKSSSEATTESDLSVECNLIGVIETVAYIRNESSTESGARTDGDLVTTVELYSAAKGKSETTRKSDAHTESDSKRRAGLDAHVESYIETTTKSSDAVVQVLSTASYEDAKNKSETTTERDALTEITSISTPNQDSPTNIVLEKRTKSSNLAAVTQAGIKTGSSTTTESGAHAGSDSVSATVSDTKSTSKSDAYTESDSVATTNSDSPTHSELEETTESYSIVENDLVTTSELHSHAQSKSIPITESDKHAEGDAEKSTKSGIRISECTESRPQIKNDAVAATAAGADAISSSEAITESDLSVACNPVGVIETVAYSRNESSRESGAHANGDLVTTSKLHSAAKGVSKTTTNSDAYIESDSERTAKFGAHVESYETTRKSSDAVIQVLSDAIARTASYAYYKNKSQTTTKRDALATTNSISIPNPDLPTISGPEKSTKLSDSVAVTKAGGYSHTKLETATVPDASAGSDIIPASVSVTEATSKSDAYTQSDSVATTNSDSSTHSVLEETTESYSIVENDLVTASELHSHAQSKSISITESDKHAEGDTEKSTTSGIRISDRTESRTQIKNDAVAPTVAGADDKSSSEATTEADLSVECNPVGVIETVAYIRNESSTESGARTDGDLLTTVELYSTARGKSETTRKSDAHTESDSKTRAGLDAHFENRNETTTKSSDAVVQALSHSIAPTASYADAKNKSETTTERYALAESTSISTPNQDSPTNILLEKRTKSSNLAAVTQAGINTGSSTATESGAHAGSDSESATVSDTKATSKSDAYTESDSVAMTNSDSPTHSELEETTESYSIVENDLVTTSELHSHARSKSIPITESDKHAEGDAEKSTKSGIRISECTESRPQIKNDAVTPTAAGADVKSSSEAITESDLSVECNPVGVIETVAYSRNESSKESGASTDGNLVTTSKLHSAAKDKSETTTISDANVKSDSERTAKFAPPESYETTRKSSDAVIQVLSDAIALTASYTHYKNKSETTTKSDALAKTNSLSIPNPDSSTKCVPEKNTKLSDLVAVTQAGGYSHTELETATVFAPAGSDIVPATVSVTEATSKSDAYSKGDSVATTNSDLPSHSELEGATESDSRVKSYSVTTRNSDSLAKRVIKATTESTAPVVSGLEANLTSDIYSHVLSTFTESDRVVPTESDSPAKRDSEVTTGLRAHTESNLTEIEELV